MLIKSRSRTNKTAFRQLLDYSLQPKPGEPGPDVVLTRNLRSDDHTEWPGEFLANEKYRTHKRRNSVRCYHEIMSFAPEDAPHLDEAVLRDLAQEYLDRRAPKAIAVVVRHRDREHVHLHLIVSGIGYRSGRPTSIPRARFAEIKLEIEELQLRRYPELVHSIAQGGRARKRRVDLPEIKRMERLETDTTIEWLRETVFRLKLKSKSGIEFVEHLKTQSIEVYYRGGKAAGVTFQKKKYRFKRLDLNDQELNRWIRCKHHYFRSNR